jgi:hypothetical protein
MHLAYRWYSSQRHLHCCHWDWSHWVASQHRSRAVLRTFRGSAWSIEFCVLDDHDASTWETSSPVSMGVASSFFVMTMSSNTSLQSFVCLVAFFCVQTELQATSRTLYALSRDRGRWSCYYIYSNINVSQACRMVVSSLVSQNGRKPRCMLSGQRPSSASFLDYSTSPAPLRLPLSSASAPSLSTARTSSPSSVGDTTASIHTQRSSSSQVPSTWATACLAGWRMCHASSGPASSWSSSRCRITSP